jgi:hypothetical protein
MNINIGYVRKNEIMMNYIPGQIHENFQKEWFFLINFDFSWSNCRDKRWGEMSDSNETDTVELSKGDIVVVRFFKSSQTSNAYTYLERVIYNNGDVTEYKTESIISLALIEKNLDPEKFENKSWLFTDVTKSFERDKKIETILC